MEESSRPRTGGGLSVAERRERGRQARKRAPRSSHADWAPAADRASPVDALAAQDAERLQFLVPVRHLRMGESAFAFYRGTAGIMAADLAPTPTSGLTTQICGDAHLSNFGVFASPEREMVFDVNDFDETLPGPWEWDLKRLATSLVLAARDLDLGERVAAEAATAAVERYRDAMIDFAGMGTLDIWYDTVKVGNLRRLAEGSDYAQRLEKEVRKARRRTSLRSFRKLAEIVDGRPRIRSDPPLLVPFRELSELSESTLSMDLVSAVFEAYRSTLSDEVDSLVSRFELVDVALKVVGVGSVGTRCFVALLIGRDNNDPLLLQVKEAGPSVLEEQLGPSPYEHSGQRVVEGQRLMQAFGDVLLGWSENPAAGRYFYWRQLKDMKGSAAIESMDRRRLVRYGGVCGWTLARAHARAGDPVAIAAYLGKSATFSRAIGSFAERYADQAEQDFGAFKQAVASGALESMPPGASPVRS